MKKILSLIILLLLTITGCGTSDSGDVKKLKLGHALTETHPVHLAMVRFAELTKERTNGSVEVVIFPNGQLGGEREITELMQAGAIDMIKTNAAPLEPFASEYAVLSLPYLFRDMEHHLKTLKSEVGEEILGLTEDRGFIGLTFYNSGTRNFYASKPINTPDDLKGMIVRVQPSKIPVRMMELLGGSATPLSFGEIYTALQQKVVDGAENNLISYADSKHSEVAKCFTFDEHSMVPDILLINTKSWDKLTPEEQKAVKSAALDSFDYQNTLWDEMEKKQIEILKSQGVEFYNVDKTPFQEKVKPMYEEAMKNERMKYFIEKIQNVK